MSTNPNPAAHSLPDRPDLRHLKDQAKDLLKSGAADSLSKAQFQLAREYGFSNWSKLKSHVESVRESVHQELGIEYEIESSQLDAFRKQGVIRLRGLLPVEKIARAREAVFHRMQDAGIWKNGKWKIGHLREAPINEGAKFARRLKGCVEFNELVNEQVPHVVGRLLDGQPTFCGMDVPQPLFTLPNADSWQVPHAAWHLDVPRLQQCGIPGVQIFTFLDTVSPTGGGTLVVAGSHRLPNGSDRISSKDVRRKLKNEPYFRDLMSKGVGERNRFIREAGYCGDVELQVVELCGEPGDVYFIDLRVLHTASPNATEVPRIMLTRRYFLTALRDMIYGETTKGG